MKTPTPTVPASIISTMCARLFSTSTMLSEAEHTMADAGSPSPFQIHSDDTTPIQRKVTHDYILRIREAMRRVMEELNIPPSEPHSGSRMGRGDQSDVLLDLT